jgi:hypothetical protein
MDSSTKTPEKRYKGDRCDVYLVTCDDSWETGIVDDEGETHIDTSHDTYEEAVERYQGLVAIAQRDTSRRIRGSVL